MEMNRSRYNLLTVDSELFEHIKSGYRAKFVQSLDSMTIISKYCFMDIVNDRGWITMQCQ